MNEKKQDRRTLRWATYTVEIRFTEPPTYYDVKARTRGEAVRKAIGRASKEVYADIVLERNDEGALVWQEVECENETEKTTVR